MQIVIDDEKIIDLLEMEWGYEGIREDITRVIRENGTPLPKGHGDLIDAGKIRFENSEFDTYGDYCRAFDAIDQADTIIEADTESEEV